MSSPVIFGASGNPEPSPEIQRRLQGIHPDLHLRFIASINGFWGVCLTIRRDDPRWERVQSGETPISSMFEIIGYLPMDCSVDQAPPYLERMLRQYPREDVSRVADFVSNYNVDSPIAQAVEEATAELLDMSDPSQTTPKRRRNK